MARAWHRLSNEINVLDREMSDLHTKVVKESDEKKRALYLANIRSLESIIRLLEMRRMTEGSF